MPMHSRYTHTHARTHMATTHLCSFSPGGWWVWRLQHSQAEQRESADFAAAERETLMEANSELESKVRGGASEFVYRLAVSFSLPR